jgi:hypothetical protein
MKADASVRRELELDPLDPERSFELRLVEEDLRQHGLGLLRGRATLRR